MNHFLICVLLKIVLSSKGYNSGWFICDSLAENVDKDQGLAFYTLKSFLSSMCWRQLAKLDVYHFQNISFWPMEMHRAVKTSKVLPSLSFQRGWEEGGK